MSMSEYAAMETRMYNLGFDQGRTQGISEAPSLALADPYAGLETTRTARAKKKKIKAQEVKALAAQKKAEDHLAKFIKRNAAEMWEYVPTLYHTQHDEHHQPPNNEKITSQVKEYCNAAYGGNLARMLHTFENKEVVERLSGSYNMRKTICPTVRMDVPNSLKTTSPHLYGSGYETGRKQHSQKMTRLFQQPLPQYMYSTNGGHASTEFRRTKASSAADTNPFCTPGSMGRTNLSGWADVNTKEGIYVRPPFLRGAPFAQAHEQF